MFKDTNDINDLIKQKDELIQLGKYSVIEILTEFQKKINENKDITNAKEYLKPINIQRLSSPGDYLCKIFINKDGDPYMNVPRDSSVSIKKGNENDDLHINIDFDESGKVGICYV